jgi:hypothetical protein
MGGVNMAITTFETLPALLQELTDKGLIEVKNGTAA